MSITRWIPERASARPAVRESTKPVGISAAVAILGMAAEARGRGASLADLVTEFGETFGHFTSDQIAIRVDDVATISRTMTALRERHTS